MSDRDSGDELSQVAQRGVHRFAFHCTEIVDILPAVLHGARLHSYGGKQKLIGCC